MMGRSEIFGHDMSGVINHHWLHEYDGVVIGLIGKAKTRAQAEQIVSGENKLLGKPRFSVGRYVNRGGSYESWSLTQSKLVPLIHGRPPKSSHGYEVISKYDDPLGMFGY